MAKEERVTLLRPPPPDPSKAPIENALEVTEIGVLGPDIYTNTREAWHPPGARGIYGGAVIAQCLASAQHTVPDDFLVHSCHCYFLLAGNGSIPILFHVERVRDGRSFATRTVQARQRGRCIFTTTISFVREGSGGAKQVRHAVPLPADARPPPQNDDDEAEWSRSGPVMISTPEIVRGRDPSAQPYERRCRQWTRARGTISAEGGHRAHLNALAYMSDNWFIGTVSRIHGLWRWPHLAPRDVAKLPEADQRRIRALLEFDGHDSSLEALAALKEGGEEEEEDGQAGMGPGRVRRLGMQVSLDHSIYFHEPARVRVDDWMFVEMESPWAGSGRGVVTQRIFARDGTLLATCMQEGLVRLKQDDEEPEKAKL